MSHRIPVSLPFHDAKVFPKRGHFTYKGMVARTKLAAIDNDANMGCKQATVERGVGVGEARYLHKKVKALGKKANSGKKSCLFKTKCRQWFLHGVKITGLLLKL